MSLTRLIKGSLTVLAGSLLLRFGGYVYRLLVGRMLGPAGYGIVSATMVVQTIVMFLATVGVPPAIARYVARYRALGQWVKVKQFILVPMVVLTMFSSLVAAVLALASPWLACNYFHNPYLTIPLIITAFGIPAAAFASCVRGAFQGFNDMKRYVNTQFVEQGTRVGGAPALIEAGYGPTGAVFSSALLAYLVSGAYGWKVLKKRYLRAIPDVGRPLPPGMVVREVLTFGLPTAMTGIADMLQSNVDLLVIGFFLGTTAMGLYDAAGPIARLPTTLCAAVATALLPAASEADALRDRATLKRYAHVAVKSLWTLLVPVAVVTGALSKPLIVGFFGVSFGEGASALYVLPAAMAFIVMFRSCASMLQGMGKQNLPMLVLFTTVAVNTVLNVMLVPSFGIWGASIATAFADWLAMIMIVRAVMANTDLTLRLRWVMAPVVAGVPSWYVARWACHLPLPDILVALVGAILAFAVYAVVLVVLGGVSDVEWEVMEKGAERVGFQGIIRTMRALEVVRG